MPFLIGCIFHQRYGEPRPGDTNRLQDFHLCDDLEYPPLLRSASVSSREPRERRHNSQGRERAIGFYRTLVDTLFVLLYDKTIFLLVEPIT